MSRRTRICICTLQHAGMPIVWIAVGVLVLGSVAAWTLLRLRRLDRDVRRLRRAVEESAREDAASEKRIRELLGFEGRAVNGDSKAKRRRHLRALPVAAFLAGVIGVVRHHPHQAVAGAATVAAAVMTLLLTGGAGGEQRAEPPVPVLPPSPTHTTDLPPLTTTPSRPTGGGTPITTPAVDTTVALLPPTAATLTTITTTTPTITPDPPSVTTTTPPPSTPACAVRVELGKLTQVCVPALR